MARTKMRKKRDKALAKNAKRSSIDDQYECLRRHIDGEYQAKIAALNLLFGVKEDAG